MGLKTPSSMQNACVHIRVVSSDCEDTGIGMVLRRRPLTVVVPAHVAVLIEQQDAEYVDVDNVRHPLPALAPAPALEKDDLVVLAFPPRPRHLIRLGEVELTRARVEISSGDPVELLAKTETGAHRLRGFVQEIRGADGQSSILTDIPVSPGMSGAPLLREGRLAAVCQGRIANDEGKGSAVAVPVTDGGLADLRRIQARGKYKWTFVFATMISLLLIAAGLAWNHFAIGGIEISEDATMLTVHNGTALTLRSSWHRLFDTPIHAHAVYASVEGGERDRIAVGTWFGENAPGAVYVFDKKGHLLWDYAVPDGECIYPPEEGTQQQIGFQVTHVMAADLDQDTQSELLVSFVHNTWYPCKLMAFADDGGILAEYWHPGYIRTLAVGRVDEGTTPMVIASASNNRMPRGWPHPQTLFAFRGLEISGQAPPYTGEAPRGSELWYRVIEDVDSTTIRAKCTLIDVLDSDGDGRAEIRARTTDGRIYTLDEEGNTLATALTDGFLQIFGSILAPVLHVAPLFEETAGLEAYHRFASTRPGEHDRILIGVDGMASLLDESGEALWSMPAPVDAPPTAPAFQDPETLRILRAASGDLDADGITEILIAYEHPSTSYSCILVVDLQGDPLGEYWHPGPIEQLASLYLGESPLPYIVGLGRNLELVDGVGSADGIFALQGSPVVGMAPPLVSPVQSDSLVWYRTIDPLPGSSGNSSERAELDGVDCNGDGLAELELALSDGRTYYLDESGRTVILKASDLLMKSLDSSSLPPLHPVSRHSVAEAAGDGESPDAQASD